MSTTSGVLEVDRRYVQQNARAAVRDVFDALTELLTNSDDAYERAERSGRIEIEIERRYKEQPTVLRVRDYADGMTAEEMKSKLCKLGDRRCSGLAAGLQVRGTNSRGAKDVTALGKTTFESISARNTSSRCTITQSAEWTVDDLGRSDPLAGTRIGIPKGTGTLVTLEIDRAVQIPQHDSLVRKLRLLVPLREILSDPKREVILRDVNQDREDRVQYHPPEAIERVKETFKIPKYPTAEGKLVIKRSRNPLENRGKFWEGGIIIKSRRAIHEATLFAPEFANDPQAAHFFGWVRCPFIDDLWNEADEAMESGASVSIQNPFPILDPTRQSGLRKDHPFYEALQKEVLKRLRPLVEEERRQAEAQRAKIENRETRKRLDELEKLATQFMNDNQEDDEDDQRDNAADIDTPRHSKVRSLILSPPYTQMVVGQTCRFSLALSQEKFPEIAVGSVLQIQCETKEITTDRIVATFEQVEGKDGFLRAAWNVKAVQPTQTTGIIVRTGPIVESAAIEVFASEKDLYSHIQQLQFWRPRCRLRPGVTKRVRLLAPFPSVVNRSEVAVFRCDNPNILISGDRTMRIREKLGIAECKITLRAEQPDFKATLTADVDGRCAETQIIVGPPEGEAIRIEIKDEGDKTNQRYRWERGTNLLIIAARHPSLRRYLGAAPAFPGQDRDHFRVLLAEIVGFAVAEKVLGRRIAQNPDEYRDADFDIFMADRDELVTKFLPLAHESQVPKPLST
ncbi:MAG: hypothetical protein IT449_13305 [Phycisphaerales bacterium]|nr:hypothetical protein [Phycisphaerales bacterium]